MKKIDATTGAKRKMAEKYRDGGYAVEFSPERNMVPAELRDRFPPDFLASRGDSRVWVEIKKRNELQDDLGLRDFAQRFVTLPDWRFDLMVIPDQGKPAPVPRLLSREDRRERIRSADRLAEDSGDYSAAILLLWTAIEATLLEAINEKDCDRSMTGARLAKEAFSRDHITSKEWATLEHLAAVRNQVAHGEAPTRVTDRTYRNARAIAERLARQLAARSVTENKNL